MYHDVYVELELQPMSDKVMFSTKASSLNGTQYICYAWQLTALEGDTFEGTSLMSGLSTLMHPPTDLPTCYLVTERMGK